VCVGWVGGVQASGPVPARQVMVGDRVTGLGPDGPGQWCTVLNVRDHGDGVVYGNFTDNHYVVDAAVGLLDAAELTGQVRACVDMCWTVDHTCCESATLSRCGPPLPVPAAFTACAPRGSHHFST
jgi:hypothetical protein